MENTTAPAFSGGLNIALKIPKHKYEETVRFYADVLRLAPEERPIKNHPTISRTHRLQFGGNTLWLDCIDNYTKSEVWLELNADDVEAATRFLEERGTLPCDTFEQIPEGTHWITDPAGTVFILKRPDNAAPAVSSKSTDSKAQKVV